MPALAAGRGGKGWWGRQSSGRSGRGICDHSAQLVLSPPLVIWGPTPTVGVGSTVSSGCGLFLTAGAAGAAGGLYSGGRCRPAGTQERFPAQGPACFLTTTGHREVIITGKMTLLFR